MTNDLIERYVAVEGIPADIARRFRTAECLVDRADIDFAVDQLAVKMTAHLQDANPLIVPVMQGGLVFAGMLMRRLAFPLRQDYVHVGRYAQTSGGDLVRHHHGPADFDGQTVVLVDDILDEGRTLEDLVAWAAGRGAERVLTAVLVTKENPRRNPATVADFSALECGPLFVIGCGLDYEGYGRNLPDIYALQDGEATP